MKYTTNDELHLQELKHRAETDVLSFRKTAQEAAKLFTREMRQRVNKAQTRDTSSYVILNDWLKKLAPDLTSLLEKSQTATLHKTLADQLNLPVATAKELAGRLVEERRQALLDNFVSQYSSNEKIRQNLKTLLDQPIEAVTDLQARFLNYTLSQAVAKDLDLTIYDANARAFKRFRLARKEKRQIKRYRTKLAHRLSEIRSQQQIIKSDDNAIVGRILSLNLDTVLALDAYRHYKKRIDALKPTSRTTSKTLDLFKSSTKEIRDKHAKSLTDMDKLHDMQRSLEQFDRVLVDIFDMTDTKRNLTMVRLKEYRELEREAIQITKQL